MNARVVLFYKKLFIFIVSALCVMSVLFGGCSNYGEWSSSSMLNYSLPSISDLFKNFFNSPFKNKDEKMESEYVYLGGFPVGLSLSTDGVIVIAKGSVMTKFGESNHLNSVDIEPGDIITHLDDYKITSTNDIELFLKTKYSLTGNINVSYKRQGDTRVCKIIPQFDMYSKKYRLGLWVRDTAAGVGTMTFIKENGEFSALGHPISDVDTLSPVIVKTGNIYKCNIIGVQKGRQGKAGELRGLFLKNGASIGEFSSNSNFGVQGVMYDKYMESLNLKKIKVGRKGSVKPGKAKILTTIDGVTPEEFEIEIVKTAVQNKPANKSMILHVTDRVLLEKTGGIVQGMSGSPIIQNDMIVGAVTHVFVNDPTRGYGLFMDWML